MEGHKIRNLVEPFGDVNIFKNQDGSLEVVACVLLPVDIEGAMTGLALDASASMKQMYGFKLGPFGGPPNVVEPVAKVMGEFLANFSAEGKTHMIYWACKPDGTGIEEIGTFSPEECKRLTISGPKKEVWGRGTKLLSPVVHFVDKEFVNATFAMAVIVTDGIIEDLDDVKKYCLEFAKKIANGKRDFIKFFLLGVGNEVDEGQMQELDDMLEDSGLEHPPTTTKGTKNFWAGDSIDLWAHRLASDMKQLEEILAELVTESMIVAPTGRILDSNKNEVLSFPDGLPAKLKFKLPKASTNFTLVHPGGEIVQDIGEAL